MLPSRGILGFVVAVVVAVPSAAFVWQNTVENKPDHRMELTSASGAAVDTVMIAGRIVMRNRALMSIDEEELKANLVEKARTARERSGIPEESRWPVH